MIPSATRGLTLFSCEPRHQRPSSPPISIPSRRNRNLYIELGARIHNLIGGSQTHHKSAKQSNRLGFQEPKRENFSPFTSTNLRGNLKPMHQMQMAIPSLSNSTKATKSIGGIREEEQRREHQVLQILQDLEPKGFPHKEGILIGECVDLDLLYLFYQMDSRIIGGRGR